MNASRSPVVIGLGELLWDEFPSERRPGGAPANVAFHVGQLGGRGLVLSRVGTDDAGDELVRTLGRRGLETTWIQRDEESPTGRVTVNQSAAGHDFVIHDDAAWDHLAFEPSLAELGRTVDAVCFGTLAQRCRTSRETIHRLLYLAGPHTALVYDVNLRQNCYQRDWIERSLRRANVVKLNTDEAWVLDGLLKLDTGDDAALAAMLRKRFDVSLVCITRGADGCLLATNAETVDLPGEPIEVADTVGAGDAFTAALITGLHRHWSLTRIAEFANHIGRLVAARPGAMPVIEEEAAALV